VTYRRDRPPCREARNRMLFRRLPAWAPAAERPLGDADRVAGPRDIQSERGEREHSTLVGEAIHLVSLQYEGLRVSVTRRALTAGQLRRTGRFSPVNLLENTSPPDRG